MSIFISEAEIENLVRAFEACVIAKEEFRHREHLAVAIWYVEKLGRDAALDQMRAGLLRFLNHHEVDPKKYSEPITVFWIELVSQSLSELGPEISLLEKCNRIVTADFC